MKLIFVLLCLVALSNAIRTPQDIINDVDSYMHINGEGVMIHSLSYVPSVTDTDHSGFFNWYSILRVELKLPKWIGMIVRPELVNPAIPRDTSSIKELHFRLPEYYSNSRHQDELNYQIAYIAFLRLDLAAKAKREEHILHHYGDLPVKTRDFCSQVLTLNSFSKTAKQIYNRFRCRQGLKKILNSIDETKPKPKFSRNSVVPV